MANLRMCFEIQGLARDENGEPCTSGFQIVLEGVTQEIEYEVLAQNISIPGVLKCAFLSEIVKPEDVRIITPEEYDRLYGEGNNNG